jgi:hypothetical protein
LVFYLTVNRNDHTLIDLFSATYDASRKALGTVALVWS